MARDWYYAVDNQQYGPVSHSEIANMIQRGQLTSRDLVWRDGMDDWGALGTVSEFAAVATPPPLPVDRHAVPSPRRSMPAADESIDNPFAAPDTDIRPEIYTSEDGFAGYAGFWKRVAAVIIDSIVLMIIGGVIGVFFAVIGEDMESHLWLVTLGAYIMVWLYFALMESSTRQATLGKQALGIKVTDLRGRRISFGRATGRFVGKNLLAWLAELSPTQALQLLFSLGTLCVVLPVAFTAQKQGIHDMIAGTLVVNRSTKRPAYDGPHE